METTTEDRMRLLDIADAIREIQGYLGEADYEEFTIRENVRESVSAQLVMIGGAAALLSDEFKEKYGEIDWDILRGFQYAHFDEELELDQHALLHIASHDLPGLLDDVLRVAETMEGDLEEDSLNEEDLKDLQDRQDKQTNASTPQAEEVFTGEEGEENEEREEQEDDSYIDRRFTDEDILKNSSLDDMENETRSPKPRKNKRQGGRGAK